MKRGWSVLILILAVSAVAASMAPSSSTAVSGWPVPVRPAPPVYMASGRLLANVHEVIGKVTGVSPMTVTLSGGARFWGADTYFCVAAGADDNQTLGPQAVNIDGARFRILHGSAEKATIIYRCLGM